MINFLDCLREFERAVADKYRNSVTVPFISNDKTAQLRIALHEEECDELSNALREEDIEQVLKEACDLLYVVFGTVVVYNLPIAEAFKRVHENNMLKMSYPINDKGKLIKPKDHPKVNLKDLFETWEDKQKKFAASIDRRLSIDFE